VIEPPARRGRDARGPSFPPRAPHGHPDGPGRRRPRPDRECAAGRRPVAVRARGRAGGAIV